MSVERELLRRSGEQCELCGAKEKLSVYEVPPVADPTVNKCVLICNTCKTQIESPEHVDVNHWRCLNDSMWSEVPAVQVVAWRMLYQLRSEGWPSDLLEMLYLDEETTAWAKTGIPDENALVHIDSNGNVLQAGDSVVLIQDLKVKGANFTAKRGTAVRRISLSHDNPEHIEGRVDGQHIVILTKYVKKSK